ncbi:hypothetical protein [Variovorax sp. Sphag1AA]|uniref:hypothetical protein n=1 Tax=Variovorax sp. Sphag1AA TaxID=2587027 RepID=UPI00161F5D3D|nr:hypothetical protein [Variovorax sp. Sphag1AA]MBB3175887.1 hypothetical protein [Variovorax sp. Sphag1AA]
MSAVLLSPREALRDPPNHRAHAQALPRSSPSAASTESAVLRSIGLAWAAGAAGKSIPAIVAERLSGDDDPGAVRSLLRVIMRAAQLPAMSDVEPWAGALALRTTVASLLDLLAQEESVLAQLPVTRYAFEGRGLIRVPVRASTSPSLAATFRREGDPIRVGGLTLTNLELAPLGVGVLATTTNEMLESALPDELEGIARASVIADSARLMDGVFLDAVPADGVRPAGLQAVGVVTPGTADIAADMRAAVTRLHDAGFGSSATRWVVHSEVAASLAEQSDEMRLNGTILKIEVVSGLSVPPDTIFLIDCRALTLAMEVPRFEASTEASLVEQDGTPYTNGVTGPVGTLDTGAPARSLWQSNSSSLRGTWPVNWGLAAAGAVQVITPQEVGP